jgi:Trypsin-like peptidase domain
MAAREHEDSPWQVRVCTEEGSTVGAGVLLGDRLVLTCAHVVRSAGVSAAGPDVRLRIDSVVCHPRWSASARMIPGCWISERGTQRGDVALLELDTPVTCHEGARLRQAPVRDVAVRACGFPDGGKIGIWAEGRLAGASYDGEWVEMHALSQDRSQWVTRGYSGAGVAGTASGDVIGIVVAVRESGSSVNAWMMSVETIVGYLPDVGSFVDGGRTSDLSPAALAQPPQPEAAVDVELRREISRLFACVWSGTAVVTGGPADAGTPWLARLVATADPAARSRFSDAAIAVLPRDATLGIGAVDLAVDAGGLTVPEIRCRIAERFGMPEDGTGILMDMLLHRQPPPAMVIDRVDSAADPAGLISELVAPLAAQARRRGLRLVLGFTGHPPGDLPYEVSLGPEPVTGPAASPAAGSPDPGAVWRLLTELADAERELAPLYADLSARVAGAPALLPSQAPRLRVRYAVSAGEAPTAELSLLHDRAQVALAEVLNLIGELRKLKQEHADLGMILDVYRERAERCFGAEDRPLGALYGPPREMLRAGPCDLAASRVLVDRYVDAVRLRMDRDREGEVHDLV